MCAPEDVAAGATGDDVDLLGIGEQELDTLDVQVFAKTADAGGILIDGGCLFGDDGIDTGTQTALQETFAQFILSTTAELTQVHNPQLDLGSSHTGDPMIIEDLLETLGSSGASTRSAPLRMRFVQVDITDAQHAVSQLLNLFGITCRAARLAILLRRPGLDSLGISNPQRRGQHVAIREHLADGLALGLGIGAGGRSQSAGAHSNRQAQQSQGRTQERLHRIFLIQATPTPTRLSTAKS
ncbi:MAG: hypothetical protein KC431_24665 [Myxococcales bacterium]|nr:hypothetical protein [Myxococcales bacterium]